MAGSSRAGLVQAYARVRPGERRHAVCVATNLRQARLFVRAPVEGVLALLDGGQTPLGLLASAGDRPERRDLDGRPPGRGEPVERLPVQAELEGERVQDLDGHGRGSDPSAAPRSRRTRVLTPAPCSTRQTVAR